MYRRILKPILFSLTIERAHRTVLLLLRIIGFIPGGRWLLRKCYAVEHPALERQVFGIRFPNPVGLAAGFDRSGEAFRELSALGFGFVEVGTVTPRPQTGNPRPRIFRLPKDRAIVNRIGLANRGLQRMIQHLRRPHEGVIVGCNIGRNTSTPAENGAGDYLKLFRNLYQYADYFTVNISCDNSCSEGASHTRRHVMQILEPLFDFRRGQNQYRPIMLKVSPDMTDEAIDGITDILLSSPLDGIVAANGSHRRDGLRTSRASLDKIGSGRISGAPLTARTVEIVRRIHTRSGGTYPIIGVGGIMSADDCRALLDAGADLVQLYTGYIYEGPRLVGDICRALVADAERKAAEETAQEPAAQETTGSGPETAPASTPTSGALSGAIPASATATRTAPSPAAGTAPAAGTTSEAAPFPGPGNAPFPDADRSSGIPAAADTTGTEPAAEPEPADRSKA